MADLPEELTDLLIPDRHMRRSGREYMYALFDLLPQGLAWTRELDSTLGKTVRGLTEYWGYVDGRAADLLEIESDPRKTTDPSQHDPDKPDGLLPEWERAFGLPDPCFPDAVTVEERRAMLIMKMTMIGGQSREFFEWVADWTGEEITITEFSPYMCGISMCGDTSDLEPSGVAGKMRWELGPPENRFYWTAHSSDPELIWFRCGEGGPENALKSKPTLEEQWTGGECGVDTHLQINVAPDLDCLINRWKPAHTKLVFDYSGSALLDDPMAGTP